MDNTLSTYTPWPQLLDTGLTKLNTGVRPLYQRTTRFRTYSGDLIGGALQTEAYTRAVLTSISTTRGLPDDVDAAVAARVERQNFLHDGRHRYEILTEEQALRSVIGGPEVMAEQLRHLLDAQLLDSVTIGIIPSGIDRTRRWPVEGFWMHDDREVSLELVAGYLQITDPAQIAEYARTFDQLSQAAVYGEAAGRLIRAALG